MALARYRISSIFATTDWAAVRHIACEDVSDTHRAVTNYVILDCLHIGTTRACIVCCGVLVHLWLSDHCILLLFCKGGHTRLKKTTINVCKSSCTLQHAHVFSPTNYTCIL